MGSNYKIRDNEGLYFITITTVGWVDVFIRREYKDCIIDSLKYCIEQKGLQVHAYVIMTSHIHSIISAKEGAKLVAIIRDFKKFTSKEILRLIKEIPESRREWMLNKFAFEANRTKRGQDYIFWQEGYHAKQIETNTFLDEKLNYIHQNPVEVGIVNEAENYVYSSAIDYTGGKGLLDIEYL